MEVTGVIFGPSKAMYENVILAGVCVCTYILISYIYLSQIDKVPFWHLLLLECKSSRHVGMLSDEKESLHQHHLVVSSDM